MATASRPRLVNVERLHRFMDEAGCAAVVARSGKNFTYLAGIAYPGTLARHLDFPDTPRDVFCIWPRTGEPVVVTHHAGRPVGRGAAAHGIKPDIHLTSAAIPANWNFLGKTGC